MRDDIETLNTFVEALRRESSAFDFPHRGKPLVADRKRSRALALDILQARPASGSPSCCSRFSTSSTTSG